MTPRLSQASSTTDQSISSLKEAEEDIIQLRIRCHKITCIDSQQEELNQGCLSSVEYLEELDLE
jgi:hypothetical protein